MQAEPEPRLAVVVAARNEAERIGATLDALAKAFPGAAIWVADDASSDGTAEVAMRHGARVVSRGRSHGKGGKRDRRLRGDAQRARRLRASSCSATPTSATRRRASRRSSMP